MIRKLIFILKVNKNIANQERLNIDFENIEYLKTGNARQRLAYETLVRNQIMFRIRQFDPILVGTIPIRIDIEDSDLDIICYYKDRNNFIKVITDNFKDTLDFEMFDLSELKTPAVCVNFKMDGFSIEIFGQDIPTQKQNAYRHMIIENRLLSERGETFRQKIIELKWQGIKTEPAFALLLGLTGNPYDELLKFEITTL